jgi:hypothetical protein
MTTDRRRLAVLFLVLGFVTVVAYSTALQPVVGSSGLVAATPTPPPAAEPPFDQAVALAKLREQIKGREKEPSTAVFKNIQTPFIKSIPAARVLAVMEIGFSRSLGVTCTHCHIPGKWEADEKSQKQTARDMAAMMAKINGELLPAIKNLKSEKPTVNCTTCHRGHVKPELNIVVPVKTQ